MKMRSQRARKAVVRKLKKAAAKPSSQLYQQATRNARKFLDALEQSKRVNPRAGRALPLQCVRITGPDGLVAHEQAHAIATLVSVTRLTKGQAKSLLQALISMCIYEVTVQIDPASSVELAISHLRAAHLLVERA